MGFGKRILLFCVGGAVYVALEWLWRGWSHSSMFLAGGSCFLLLGKLDRQRPRLPLFLRGLTGAGIITMVELLAGLLFNRDELLPVAGLPENTPDEALLFRLIRQKGPEVLKKVNGDFAGVIYEPEKRRWLILLIPQ